MKHFYGYTPDGKLWWTFVHTGGFPVGCDLDDPECTDPLVLHLLANYNVNQTHNETLQGIVKYECACDPEVGICSCAPTKRLQAFSDNGTLTDKPDVTLIVDGVTVASDDTITKYPGQLFTLKVQADTPAEIPDDETADVFSAAMLETPQALLTFTNGISNELTLRAPAQGITGHLSVLGKLVKHHRIFIKGFATT